MNKLLFEKVKSLCKDTGLSEKYLKAITEKAGGSIEDDSTDETAIGETANLIADIAKETQGEATRWVNKPKPEPKPNTETKPEPEPAKGKDTSEARIKALEEKIAEMQAKEAKSKRISDIEQAMEKHQIPASFRKRLMSAIGDDEDIEEAVATIRQDFINAGLVKDESKGNKAASEKQIDEAADALLADITAK